MIIPQELFGGQCELQIDEIKRETTMSVTFKKKFQVRWCSRLLAFAVVVWSCIQLALVPSGPLSSPPHTKTSSRRIVYVHIGKTGGEWIKSQLAVICQTRKNPKLKQACLDSFHSQSDLPTHLSRQTIGYFHVHNVYPRNAHALASHYLFSVRHPLKRLLSWYVYNHPKSCDPRESNSPSCKRNEWKLKFFDCFPTLEDLGNVSGEDECAQILWNGWYGHLSNVKEPNHLYWNYQFYWNQTLAPSFKPILVVRQERLTLDMNDLESFLGPTSMPIPWRPSDSQHFVTGRVSSTLTLKSTKNLCCLLEQELEIYQRIVELAENLSIAEKKKTRQEAYQVCGMDHSKKDFGCTRLPTTV